MKRSARLTGHALSNEGRIASPMGEAVCCGPARCSCGEESADELHGAAARKRWHRQHKDKIRARTEEDR